MFLLALAPVLCSSCRREPPRDIWPTTPLRGRAAALEGRVCDRRSGRPMHARVRVEDGAGLPAGAVLPSVGFWCDGYFKLPVLPGRVRVRITAGPRRAFEYTELVAKPGGRARVEARLKTPGPLRFEERGWFGVDLFRPVAGGDALRVPATLELLALAARAEGVGFLGAGPPFSEEALRTGKEDPEKVRESCGKLSGPEFTVVPAGRSESPFYGGLFFLTPRGGPEPPRGWELARPNFMTTAEVRERGGLAVLYGIAGAKECDPNSEIAALSPGLARYYEGAPVALLETACELPFDVVGGAPPDAMAIRPGSAADEAVWFRLLSDGHRIPAVHAETKAFGAGCLPRERVFVYLGPGGRPTFQSVAAAVREGRCFSTNGPFIFLSIGGGRPGTVIKTDAHPLELRIEAYSSTEPGSEIERIELVRNGEVVRSIPGRGRSLIVATLSVAERSSCWYLAKAYSGPGRGPSARVGWTAPVYFEGPDRSEPRPVLTRVRGRVRDGRTREPLSARVEARLAGRIVASGQTDRATGAFRIECPPAATLRVTAPGHGPSREPVFFYTRAPREIRAIHVNASGRKAEVLADRATYEKMRLACAEAEMDFLLEPLPGGAGGAGESDR